MSSIEVSPAYLTAMVSRIFRQTDSAGVNVSEAHAGAGLLIPNGGIASAFGSAIILMKGTPPAGPSLGNISARASDVLVRFPANLTYWTQYANYTTNPVNLTSVYQFATASGIATWFLWAVYGSSGAPPSDTSPIYHEIVGTVGLAGSGADLEMVDTNIVNGVTYQIANLKIQFPTIWTY
jgi:hypothetical protein